MTTASTGSFIWYDLLTTDPTKAAEFYAHVAGWTPQPWGGTGYTLFVGSQGPLAGAAQLPEVNRKMGAPPHWTANVQVADVDATAAQAKKLGGKVMSEPADFPKVGRLGLIGDPQGGLINILKPNDAMQLHDTTKAGEFCWSELLTTDHVSAFAFYSKLFGWEKRRDFDMGAKGQYLIYGTGSKELGGMFTKTKDMPMPPTWFYYIKTDDLEAAIERAKGKGGKVMNGPMDVPGGARIAQLTDPQGAMFALHQEPKKN